MKDLQQILKNITQLTNNIETNYPELYHFLDENPMTLPAVAHPELDINVFSQYLEDLKLLLKRHLKSHKGKLE